MNRFQKNIILITLILLLLPLIAMQFTIEINWSLMDFILMGVILIATGFSIDIIIRKINPKYKIAIVIAVLILFFLLWAELAVGIFNSPISGT